MKKNRLFISLSVEDVQMLSELSVDLQTTKSTALSLLLNKYSADFRKSFGKSEPIKTLPKVEVEEEHYAPFNYPPPQKTAAEIEREERRETMELKKKHFQDKKDRGEIDHNELMARLLEIHNEFNQN